MKVELAVIGAGLAGCSLLARLHQLGWKHSIALVEAGRGPGGRTASRRRRDDPSWCLDHGAPGFDVTPPLTEGVEAILAGLKQQGKIREEWNSFHWLDLDGSITTQPDPHFEGQRVQRLRGDPAMASVCEGLLALAGEQLECHFGERVRWLHRLENDWLLANESRQWTLRARLLVLSGTLLAHPRSQSLLGWPDIPLREAVGVGMDPALDQVLNHLLQAKSSQRWNLMLDLPQPAVSANPMPRQLWLTERAQQRWGVERLVMHPQRNGRLGVVMHGLDTTPATTPDNQQERLAHQERRLLSTLNELARHVPALQPLLTTARSLGVMRWGAAKPLDHPLPQPLQWCSQSNIGFCGDWIEGVGFGRAEGALRSGVDLAEQLIKIHESSSCETTLFKEPTKRYTR